jgi:nicotinamidase-related amidase
MTEADKIQEFFTQRGFGRLIGFGKSPALLVIDFQRAFTNPSLPLGANLDREIAESVRVLGMAREAEIPIYFTASWYEDEQFRDAGIWAIKQGGITTLRAGTPEVEIDPRLERRPNELIIVKKYASAFFGTDLISRLTAHRIDTVFMVGCTTSGCVRATAVDALQHGFRGMVVREAVGDRAKPAHEQSLFDLHAKYADVISADEAIEYLSRIKAQR